jgi:hypothetical protein
MFVKENKRLTDVSILFFLIVISVSFVKAQDLEVEAVSPEASAPTKVDSKAKEIANHRKLTIQFDDELVKGQQSTPEADYIFTRSQFNYKKMIRLRENFIPELEKGKDEFRGKH